MSIARNTGRRTRRHARNGVEGEDVEHQVEEHHRGEIGDQGDQEHEAVFRAEPPDPAGCAWSSAPRSRSRGWPGEADGSGRGWSVTRLMTGRLERCRVRTRRPGEQGGRPRTSRRYAFCRSAQSKISSQNSRRCPAFTILSNGSPGEVSVVRPTPEAGTQSQTRSPLLPACICARSLAPKSVARCCRLGHPGPEPAFSPTSPPMMGFRSAAACANRTANPFHRSPPAAYPSSSRDRRGRRHRGWPIRTGNRLRRCRIGRRRSFRSRRGGWDRARGSRSPPRRKSAEELEQRQPR